MIRTRLLESSNCVTQAHVHCLHAHGNTNKNSKEVYASYNYCERTLTKMNGIYMYMYK